MIAFVSEVNGNSNFDADETILELDEKNDECNVHAIGRAMEDDIFNGGDSTSSEKESFQVQKEQQGKK